MARLKPAWLADRERREAERQCASDPDPLDIATHNLALALIELGVAILRRRP
jgi:hypothetical protein